MLARRAHFGKSVVREFHDLIVHSQSGRDSIFAYWQPERIADLANWAPRSFRIRGRDGSCLEKQYAELLPGRCADAASVYSRKLFARPAPYRGKERSTSRDKTPRCRRN